MIFRLRKFRQNSTPLERFAIAGVILTGAIAVRCALQPFLHPLGVAPFITAWSSIIIISFLCGKLYGFMATAAFTLFGMYLMTSTQVSAAPIMLNAIWFYIFSLLNVLIIDKLAGEAEINRVIARELNHRSRNLLQVILSIAHRSLDRETNQVFIDRITALARVDSALTSQNEDRVPLKAIMEAELQAVITNHNQINLNVPPDIKARSRSALIIALIVHELTTNAAKYGALSNNTGTVAIKAGVVDGTFKFSWVENSKVIESEKIDGFGTKLIKSLASSLGGFCYLGPEGDASFLCRLEIPASFLNEKS